MTKIKKLKLHFSEIKRMKYVNNLLQWDQQVYMPEGSNKGRSELIALIEQISHNKLISEKTKSLIKEAGKIKELDDIDSAILREAKRDYEKAIKIPTELVTEIAKTAALGHKAWEKARKKSSFSEFQPYLEKMIELQKEYADRIDIGPTRYDTLLDDYEPGATSKWLDKLFGDLKSDLKKILDKLMSSDDKPNQDILKKYYDPEKQLEFSLDVVKKLNFDFNIGRQDKSVHPFTVSICSKDVRITTRVWENFLPACLMGSIHECGHALYDMGFMEEIHDTNIADGSSLGIHESQSRLYENIIGRGEDFWKFWYPKLQQKFPENLENYPMEEFYRSLNTVEPSLIRVEADELTYSMHIILRYELEKLIFEDSVNTNELPQLWNEKSDNLLNITPPDDAKGILQDVHWSGGAFGYFPTYALGNLYGAQIYSVMISEIPDLPQQISNGNFDTLLSYLRENVHQYGNIYRPRELIKRISGKELDPNYFIDYLENKFYPIYRM